MKILHLITGLAKASGVTTFVENVVEQQKKVGHEVWVVTVQTSFEDVLYTVDVVHIHGLWTPWLHRVSVAAHRAGKKVVWSTHGMTAPWALRHKWWKKWLPWHLYQLSDLKKADLIHSTSAKEVEWNQALGLKRQVLAPLGTSLCDAVDKSREMSAPKILLYVGRVYPVKALDRLIEAFAQVSRGNNWELRIVGPDQAGHMASLQLLVSRLHLMGRVHFVGPKYGEDLDAEYVYCDALALVSHTENFGATVVDAMAHGKPVVTSTNTPWQEAAELGAGWWVPNDVCALSKALEALIALDDESRRLMGEKGRQLVAAKYTWQAVAETMVRAYERVMKH